MRTATITARSLLRVYRGDPQQVARVRHDLAAFLRDMPKGDDVVLVGSELSANAIVHVGSQMFIVRCEVFSSYVWVEVQDSGADWHPRLPDDRPHGTDLVELLAEDWGTERSTEGDRVTWARVAR